MTEGERIADIMFPHPQGLLHRNLARRINEAIASRDALLAECREAMAYAISQEEGDGTPLHHHWSARFRAVLAKLEEKP